ncbi:helicase-related protein [Qipengyuania sp. SM2507]
MADHTITAVLGPTNTGKTHLAIERMCGHSSGAIGFPLRLLAREVYDRVCALKGEANVALITGEQRIEPANAKYLCCTVEAMPRDGGNRAFVALDEAQLSADRERGHLFTDRLLNARGREETMLLGAATLAPLVRQLVPEAEITQRPRFSTLKHIGPRKLSRLPPRSAIVAFSSEQVYAVAEMLRRFRGGAAVVMGALSPETRNKQVALFQNGEVDYIVATDAIGMGLNLDVTHVAFAGLTKYDGVRTRRLVPAEMAQIAGRAGRHQRDGTFGTLGGGIGGGASPEFTEEEIYAIEEHRFAPLTKLFWREPEPRFDSIAALIADLETPPAHETLRLAPEAIDLATLKRLAEEPLAAQIRGAGQVRRFWEACSLPDFRQRGPDVHARFVARLWQDLHGGFLGADYVAARISELDNMAGDIDTLQGRIAAIRSWAYICQRPDWVLARDEMAARARAVEARLSDALHARLTERFVNRRTALLMKSMGEDPAMLPIAIDTDGTVRVEEEPIGRVDGLRFTVDHAAGHADRKMLLAAAEKALPQLLGERAEVLAKELAPGTPAAGLTQAKSTQVTLSRGALRWGEQVLAKLAMRDGSVQPMLEPSREVTALPPSSRAMLMAALEAWLDTRLAVLEPLAKLQEAARDPEAGSEARALLLNLIAGHGFVSREQAGIEHLPKEMRPFLRRIGVTFGALDIFAPALLKPAPRQLLAALGLDRRPLEAAMLPVIPGGRKLPAGYRHAGSQAIRVDLAEKIFRAAHETRAKTQGAERRGKFVLDLALPVSIGLEQANAERLLGQTGFRVEHARPLADGAFGPARPHRWSWRPSRRKPERAPPPQPAEGNAFAELAKLVR